MNHLLRSPKNRARRFVSAAAFFLCTFCLNLPPGINAQETITIGMAGENFSFLLFRIAQEKGFYKKLGLNVQGVRMPGANVAISALVTGNLDYGTHYPVIMLWGVKGLGTRVVFSVAPKQMFSLVTQPEIQSPKDLKGKVLGAPFVGGLAYKIMLKVLRNVGIDPDKDVRFIPTVNDQARVQQLKAKQIHATVLNPPVSIMMRKEGFKLLLHAADYLDVPLTAVGTTTKKIKENRNSVSDLPKSTNSESLGISLGQLRKNQMGCRRADIDADRIERDPLRAPHRVVFIHESFGVFVKVVFLSHMQCQFFRFQVIHAR